MAEGCYYTDDEIASMETEHAEVMRVLKLHRRALYELVRAHNGYQMGAGPCICAAHEDARRLLGMSRDDVMPEDLRGSPNGREQ